MNTKAILILLLFLLWGWLTWNWLNDKKQACCPFTIITASKAIKPTLQLEAGLLKNKQLLTTQLQNKYAKL